MNTIRFFVYSAILCWVLAAAIGTGLFKMKNDMRELIFSILSLAAGAVFFSFALTHAD